MLVSADPIGGAGAALDAVVFSVGEVLVTRGEILRWAVRHDPGFAARLQRRRILAARDFGEDPALDAAVEEATSEFRYERELESAESLVRWAETRGITIDDWWEALRRSVLERRFDGVELDLDPGLSSEDGAEHSPSDADLVATDLLDAATEALSRRMAVAESTGARPPRPAAAAGAIEAVDAFHDSLESAWNGWRDAQLSETALRQTIERERLAWLVFTLVQSRWTSEAAAQEAIACVRVDGMTLEEAAREAGVSVRPRECLLADLPPDVRDELLTAAPGELVGPIARATDWLVIAVRAKKAPTLEDPLARAAAARAVESRAVAPLLAQHVRREAGR